MVSKAANLGCAVNLYQLAAVAPVATWVDLHGGEEQPRVPGCMVHIASLNFTHDSPTSIVLRYRRVALIPSASQSYSRATRSWRCVHFVVSTDRHTDRSTHERNASMSKRVLICVGRLAPRERVVSSTEEARKDAFATRGDRLGEA